MRIFGAVLVGAAVALLGGPAGAQVQTPNINLIPPNSITLVETNQRFIESYMVGLNHEFARKLLWREYPTDQRGSYFRQFWDVKGIEIHDLALEDWVDGMNAQFGRGARA